MKRATPQADIADSGQTISIHALVKRATLHLRSRHLQGLISIHALVKRATYATYGEGFGVVISIHALVKRATDVNFGKVKVLGGFQSTPS